MNLPIRVRLTLWFTALLSVIVTALGAFLVLQLRTDLRNDIDSETRASAETLATALAADARDRQGAATVDEVVDDFRDAATTSLPVSGSAQLLDDQGRVLAGFGRYAGSVPLVTGSAVREALAGTTPTYQRELGNPDQDHRVVATSFRDGAQRRLLVVALSLKPEQDAVRRVLVLLLIAGPVVLAGAAWAAHWVSRKALHPVERMTADARAIGAGDLNERIALPATQDEVHRLAVTLNDMLARIEQGVVARQRLVADASHELRTPLAVMRAELDVSLRGDELPGAAREVLESTREEVDRVARAVDNLLALAALDEGRLELLTGPVDLRAAADSAAGPLRMLAVAKEVTLVVEGDPVMAQADPQRLNLALTNLIENAVKFSPSGTTVRVSCWRRAEEVGVTVSDEGPGIPLGDRPRLFDRYYQVEAEGTKGLGGSGLGLAISREVATAHGGRLWVESEVGKGSAFSLALPGWRALRTPEPDGDGDPARGPVPSTA